MIQANELRIGNIVSDFGGREARISAITERGTIKLSSEHYTDESFNLNERVINPIPLTEEWMLKFEGVNESSDDDEFHAFDFEYKGIELCKDWESGKFYHINDSALVWLDYVHTFQNLIFALTGEELKQKGG